MTSWSSFSSGAIIGSAIWAGLWLTMPAPAPTWRQCAPVQEGERLVSSAQYPDHTDCFYTRNISKGSVLKKKVNG